MREVMLCVMVFVFGLACGPSESRAGKQNQGLSLRGAASFDDAPHCGLDMPQCAERLSCITVPLTTGAMDGRCVDLREVCERLACAEGECAVLLSFPGQVVCQ